MGIGLLVSAWETLGELRMEPKEDRDLNGVQCHIVPCSLAIMCHSRGSMSSIWRSAPSASTGHGWFDGSGSFLNC